MFIVKFDPAVRAVTFGTPRVSNDCVLQVTLSFVPKDESSVSKIWLLAVTAVVLTVTEVADAAITTEPVAADVHTAGLVEDEQFVAVEYSAGLICPVVFAVGIAPLGVTDPVSVKLKPFGQVLAICAGVISCSAPVERP